MRWYMIALLVCLVIGPFDALYMYIKAEKRKDELRKRDQAAGSGEQGKGKRNSCCRAGTSFHGTPPTCERFAFPGHARRARSAIFSPGT